MRELPILMNGEMVRAILDGTKTQTRRPVTLSVGNDNRFPTGKYTVMNITDPRAVQYAPYSEGDTLWVRETWQDTRSPGEPQNARQIMYRADDNRSLIGWRPSIHMPRWAARIFLTVTSVRVERLNQVTNQDILREGIRSGSCNVCIHAGGSGCEHCFSMLNPFRTLWDSIYAKRGLGWSNNPWVWVTEFKVQKVIGKGGNHA